MSAWVHAFCNTSVATVTPEELEAGIAQRLRSFTVQFRPESEAHVDETLSHLRIKNISACCYVFDTFLIYYQDDTPLSIRLDRGKRDHVNELLATVLAQRTEPGAHIVRQLLAEVAEDVRFCLKAHDTDGIAVPLALAAAACLVDKAGGLIQSGAYFWMIPDVNGVKVLLQIDG